jgi:hypothetical protein
MYVLVAKKLVPTPTKKLNTIGTARLALTCIVHPTIRVAAIVTLISADNHVHGNQCSPRLIWEEHESSLFQTEFVRTGSVIASNSGLLFAIRLVHEATDDQGGYTGTDSVGNIAYTDDDVGQPIPVLQQC